MFFLFPTCLGISAHVTTEFSSKYGNTVYSFPAHCVCTLQTSVVARDPSSPDNHAIFIGRLQNEAKYTNCKLDPTYYHYIQDLLNMCKKVKLISSFQCKSIEKITCQAEHFAVNRNRARLLSTGYRPARLD